MCHQHALRCGCALIVVGAAAGCACAAGLAAVSVPAGGFDEIFAAAGTTHGWRFMLEAPIRVTELGLYDKQGNGMQIAHPVGLWDGEGSLLRSVVIGAGGASTLIDRFRYEDTPDIVLNPGQWYTVGYYADGFALNDGMIVADGDFTVDTAILYEGFSVFDFTDGLHIPLTPNTNGFNDHFGANFRFEVVPAPGGAAMVITGAMIGARRRRRA